MLSVAPNKLYILVHQENPTKDMACPHSFNYKVQLINYKVQLISCLKVAVTSM